MTADQAEFMEKHAVHYGASDQELNTPMPEETSVSTCPVVSAGHTKHEYTTGCAWPKIKE